SLSQAEIAKAFLTNEETVGKRIYRAKEKIRKENIELELPGPSQITARLDGVLKCLYLLFNEGYNSCHPEQLIREELCEEAMRLCYLLSEHELTGLPRTYALLALFCFQTSRLQARLDDKGNIILLKYQDRRKWYQPLIRKGFYYMDQALHAPFDTSPYHLEAAIASLHASAKSFEDTDWKGIHFLYDQLYRIQPTPVVGLNKAIALAYAKDASSALQELHLITELDDYYLYHTALGEIHYECGNRTSAKAAFEKALELTTSRKEQQLLQEKIKNCLDKSPGK
ncbi:MAG TPA: DUF6596 domain-containing protein, partial [Chitinophagaceae bacterium]|nr:DUF6596 domain-containing protein [Chitinophagaceae bacterium]